MSGFKRGESWLNTKMTKHNKLAPKWHLDDINPNDIHTVFSSCDQQPEVWSLQYPERLPAIVKYAADVNCRWGGEKKWRWHTHTHTPEPWRGNSVLFLFSLICIILFFGVLLSFSCVPVTGVDCLAPRRLLSLVSVHAALPSRGAILTVGVAVNQLKLAAPLY